MTADAGIGVMRSNAGSSGAYRSSVIGGVGINDTFTSMDGALFTATPYDYYSFVDEDDSGEFAYIDDCIGHLSMSIFNATDCVRGGGAGIGGVVGPNSSRRFVIAGDSHAENRSPLAAVNVGSRGDDADVEDTYLSTSRFGFETAVSIFAAVPNVLIVTAIRRVSCGLAGIGSRGGRPTSVYNILFANLAIANCLSTGLLWLCNNLLYLFHDYLGRMFKIKPCLFFVHMAAAVFVSMAFGLVTTLTMLGFSTVQYSAICRPLQHRSVLSRRKVVLFLVVIWSASLLAGAVPLGYLWGTVRGRPCVPLRVQLIGVVVRHGANASAGFLGAVHVVIFVQCALIFRRMLVVRREMTPFRYARDMRSERRAIVTIVILLLTLNVFFVPYTIMTLLTLNWPTSAYVGNSALIYYMNFLPHVKCMADPVIYGLRMREMRNCWIQLRKLCGRRRRRRRRRGAAVASSGRSRSCRSSQDGVAAICEAAAAGTTAQEEGAQQQLEYVETTAALASDVSLGLSSCHEPNVNGREYLSQINGTTSV